MSLNAELRDFDTVEVRGAGSAFLKVKSWIVSMIGIDGIMPSAKEVLRLSASDFAMLLPDMEPKPSLSPELAIFCKAAMRAIAQHSDAREVFFDVLTREGLSIDLGSWGSKLKPHQQKAVEAMTTDGLLGMCLFDEQGTGKTLTTIAAFDVLFSRGELETLVLVGPKTLVKTWNEEFNGFLPGKYRVVEVSGSSRERMEALRQNADVFLISYESATSDRVAIEGLMREREALLVIDESFMVKNSQANRSIGVESIRRFASRAFILCGTPAPNNAYDLVHQFDLADMGFTFKTFKKTKNLEVDAKEIEHRVMTRGTFIRRTKDLVLPELATKDFEVVECPMTPLQSELYEKAKRDLVLFLRRLDNTSFRRELGTYFQKRAVLTQVSVSPALIGAAEIDSGKYQKLKDLVNDFMAASGDRKIIIWSAFTKSSDHIQEMFKQFGLVRVDGTNKDADERQAAIVAFQSDPKIRVFLGNPAAAGAGLTLTAADTAIYVSISNQAATYMQSIDRIHRIGQKASVVSYKILISAGTVDKSDVARISRKQTAQSWILGDGQLGGLDLDQALAELVGD